MSTWGKKRYKPVLIGLFIFLKLFLNNNTKCTQGVKYVYTVFQKKNPLKGDGAQHGSISRAGNFLVCTHKWFLKAFFNV